MHELSLATELVAVLQSVAKKHKLSSVKSVKIGLGPLSAVHVPTFCDAVSLLAELEGFPALTLSINLLPLMLECLDCGEFKQFPISERGYIDPIHNPEGEEFPRSCPKCGSSKIRFVDATAIVLQEIEGDRANGSSCN